MYDEAEYGDTLKSWVVPTYMLCAYIIVIIKDSYSFEMRMCGTVKCRPTLAYRVHFDSINISHWTDYKILLQREIGPMLF